MCPLRHRPVWRSVEEPGVGQYVLSSIQRVFSSNFKGEESEPKAWISTGEAQSVSTERCSGGAEMVV